MDRRQDRRRDRRGCADAVLAGPARRRRDALWAQTQRQGGYVDFGTTSYSTAGYALASDTIGMHAANGGWDAASALVGTVRLRVNPAAGSSAVFIGIAPAGAADRYLAGVAYAAVRGTAGHHGTYTEHAGSAPAVHPAAAGIWAAQASGPGTQMLTWAVKSGDWMIVAMNADGSQPVSVQVNVAATLPAPAVDRHRPADRRARLPDRRSPADRISDAQGVPAAGTNSPMRPRPAPSRRAG